MTGQQVTKKRKNVTTLCPKAGIGSPAWLGLGWLMRVWLNIAVVRMRQAGWMVVIRRWGKGEWNAKSVTMGPLVAASGLTTSWFVTVALSTSTTSHLHQLVTYATAETVDWVMFRHFTWKTPVPIRFFNPVILTQNFVQSRNPKGHIWYPESHADFCFKIPSPEFQIRDITDPEKTMGRWAPSYLYCENGILEIIIGHFHA